jgi:hypothetical protein
VKLAEENNAAHSNTENVTGDSKKNHTKEINRDEIIEKLSKEKRNFDKSTLRPGNYN